MSDYDKAKAIYEWECANIAYDLDCRIYSAQECWDQRKGVCQAYSDLFVKPASHCQLEAVTVSGDAKTLAYMDGDGRHAWVKVNTENGWILVDPTWGAGTIMEQGFVFYDHNMSWFDVDPEIMVFTHFPDNQDNMFLEEPVTKEQYKMLPLIKAEVTFAGWDAHELLDYFLSHLGEPAPLFYKGFTDGLGKFELVQMPFCGNMKVGETYILKIRSLDANVAPQGNWLKNGDLYQMVFHPDAEGELNIFLSGCGGIMKYEVNN
ncbi:MAG: hypothetical protein J6P73_02515 [Bacteroidales bacterium]|nr:hypothetical protein [Bacteroidales bacterium]